MGINRKHLIGIAAGQDYPTLVSTASKMDCNRRAPCTRTDHQNREPHGVLTHY
jgi:hypothetical protein